MDGATVAITGSLNINGNSVAGGNGAGGFASAFGSGIFLQGSTSALTFEPASGFTQTVANVIADQTGSGGTGGDAGSIGITKNGAGTLILSGVNTYSGGTIVKGGTLSISSDENLGAASSGLTLDGGTLRNTAGFMFTRAITVGSAGGGFQTDVDQISTGAISGEGGVTKTGTGTLTLWGDNTYTGATTVNAGTLRAGRFANAFGKGSAVTVNSGATLDLDSRSQTIGSLAGSGNVSLGTGTLTSGENNTSTTFSGRFSGFGGGLNKIGTGTLTLSGDNSAYTGLTTVTAGTLQAGIIDNAFGQRSEVVVGVGATLDLNNHNQTIYKLAGSGYVNLGTGTLTTTFGTVSTFGGQISGSGGLTTIGSGTLTLSGANSYTGATTVNYGTLQAGAVNTFSAASAVTLAGGTTLNLAGYDQAIGSLTGLGSVTLGTATLTTGANDGSTDYGGVISGTGGLTKTGSGTLTLTGDNTYTGATTINGGTLRLGDGNLSSTRLSADTVVTVNSGGTLDVNGQMVGKLAGNDVIYLKGGTLTNGNTNKADYVYSAIDLDQGATTNTLSSNGELKLVGNVSGGSVTVAGTGQVSYGVANTYTGTTTINAGATLQTVAASVEKSSGIINNGALIIVDYNGNDGTLSQSIEGSGSLTRKGFSMLTLSGINSYSGGTSILNGRLSISDDRNLGDASGPLTLAGGILRNTAVVTTGRSITLGSGGGDFLTDADLTATGPIMGDPASNGRLYKEGAGTLTLTGNNTYTGDTVIWAGTLSVSKNENLGDVAKSELILDGGTLRTTGAFDTARTINLEGNGGTLQTDADLTASGLVRGDGTLVKTGAGTLTLTGGTNGYRGGTQIDAGTLAVSADANLGDITGAVSFDGGTLRTTDVITTARSIVLETGGGTLQTDANLIADGIVSGVGALTKTGAGTLTLTGTNTYTGGTTIAGGTVSIAGDQNLGATAGQLTLDGGTLQNTAVITTGRAITIDSAGGVFHTDADLNSTGTVSGAGGLTKTGAGTLTLTGTNTYAGGTTISAGTLAGNATSFGGGDIANNAALLIEQPTDATLTNTVTGSGTVTKTGAGTLTLTGTNTYAGGSAINGGTLAGNAASLGSGAIANNAALLIDQPADATLANTVTGGGTLTKTGAGTLTLTGTNTYAGGTTISAGILAGNATSFGTEAITNNAALLIEQPVDATLTNTVTGSGTLTKTGAGTLTLTGTNTYAGGTTISAGTLAGNAGSFGNGAIANNAALLIEQPTDAILTNTVTGSGTLTKTGAGTLTLTGTNTYAGGTTISAGTLAGNAASFGSGAIANNAALLIEQPVDATLT
ncbi:beta strand repeat-containing protein, partial [Variovorax sp. JS1663]|uniref:beta strand repeat-containing protein n=1 Tax=Variovorax sp. JS1663 TaxID=1851577 RepID=UPI0018641940